VGYYYEWEPSATKNGTEKFTGYLRDAESGLDYAVNRYMQPGMGRFLTADPSAGSDPASPETWNRYAYVLDDPINYHDPYGREACPPDDPCQPPSTFPGPGGSPGLGTPDPPFGNPEPVDPLPPICNTKLGNNKSTLAFVSDNYNAALCLAAESGVSVSWLLGWAAEESGYGGSPQAGANQNHVNESLPKGSVTGGWVNAVACPAGSASGWACFNSFYDSFYAALYTQHQSWSYPGQTNPSVLSIISAVLSANPNATESQVFQAVAGAGFDAKGSPTNAGYGDRVQNVTAGVIKRLKCLGD